MRANFLLILVLLITACPTFGKENPTLPTSALLEHHKLPPPPISQLGTQAARIGAGRSTPHLISTQVPQYLTEGKTVYHKGSYQAGAIGKNLFQYVLMIGGIGAATSVMEDYSKTGKIRPERALDFLSNSQFIKTSMGIFAGATLLSVAGSFLPPGLPLVLKTVPGFLGASLGFEWAQGDLKNINLTKAILSSLASSAAFVALGSSGALAIGAGILASMAADAVYEKFLSKRETKELSPIQPSFEAWNPVLSEQMAPPPEPDQPLNPQQRIRERVLFRQLEEAAKNQRRDRFLDLREKILERD